MGLLYAIDHGSIEIIQGMPSDQPSVLIGAIFRRRFFVIFHHFSVDIDWFLVDFDHFWVIFDHILTKLCLVS